MNENINLCEILKDTPKGTLLYTPLIGKVEFEESKYNSIYVKHNNVGWCFTSKGQYLNIEGSECLLFPSKDQRDWNKFQKPFKDGDILTTKLGTIFIYRSSKLEEMSSKLKCYAHIAINFTDKPILYDDEFAPYMSMCSFATEEEKQKLFQAIKDNGYCWDEETNTLKQLTKFKVGDRIRAKDNGIYCTLGNYSEGISAYRTDIGLSLTYKDLEQWEFAPNKFDISTLKPFDKVLVRDSQYATWVATLFSHIDDSEHYPYVTTYINTKYCIPYNIETEHLVGTTLEEPEFYKL